MRITFCGTGGGGASAERSGSCILLDDGDRGMLLDCGPGSIGAILRSGLALPKASLLVVSHLHMDHVLGFDDWLAHLVFPYRVIPRVVGPPGTRAFVELVGKSTGMVHSILGEKFGEPIQIPVTELADGEVSDHAEAKVRSIVVPHAPEVVAMAHRVEFGGATVVYSGDTCAVPDLMIALAEGADVLIHEAYSEAGLRDWTRGADSARVDAIFAAFARSHTRVDVAAKLAAEAGVKRLVLTHLCPGEDAERLRAEAAAHFSGEVVIAADGLTLPV
ncbi:MAG: MBL fold metallo-hydrolase [bacterium]